jgi:hypothetical protein
MEVLVDGKHAFPDVVEDERVQRIDGGFHERAGGAVLEL